MNLRYLPRRVQGDPDDTAGETDESGASNHDEDKICVPKRLLNTSELGRKCLEQREEDNSPQGARNELDDPGSEAATPSDAHRHQECPRNIRDERVDRMNGPDQNRAPGGDRGEQGESRGIEVDSDYRNVVNDAECDGTCPRCEENEGVVETNAQRQDQGPGGAESDQVESRAVEHNWKREIDGDGILYVGNGGRKDGATSGA